MIYTTTDTQRSLTNSWAAPHSPIDTIPSGVITDLQFTIPEYTRIFLTSLRSSVGVLSLIFRDDRGELIGTVQTTTVGKPVALECSGEVTGSVLLGYIPEGVGNLVSTPIQINPELISTYTTDSYPKQKLSVYQDGVELYNDILTEDMVILEGDNISFQNKNSELTVDYVGADIPAIKPASPSSELMITSINGVKGAELDVIITITAPETAEDQIKITNKGNTVTVDSTALADTLNTQDPIDSRLAPDDNRDYEYYPLDDAYIKVTNNGEYLAQLPRDTKQGLLGAYQIQMGGSTATQARWVSDIDKIDPNYDSQGV